MLTPDLLGGKVFLCPHLYADLYKPGGKPFVIVFSLQSIDIVTRQDPALLIKIRALLSRTRLHRPSQDVQHTGLITHARIEGDYKMAAFQSQLYLRQLAAQDTNFEEDELYLTLQEDDANAVASSSTSTLPDMPPKHFLAISRSANGASSSSGGKTFDTSTVAAVDFDVDVKTGFMPPRVPVVKLKGKMVAWEEVRDDAAGLTPTGEVLTLGVYATPIQKKRSAAWRRSVESVRLLTFLDHLQRRLQAAHRHRCQPSLSTLSGNPK